jgi:hypothetical protein
MSIQQTTESYLTRILANNNLDPIALENMMRITVAAVRVVVRPILRMMATAGRI